MSNCHENRWIICRKSAKACIKLKEMILVKKEAEGIKTLRELGAKISFYADEGVEIDENNLGTYFRKKKGSGLYTFPTVEKLRAMGLFLGYELTEFYNLLFDKNPHPEPEIGLTMQIWEMVKRLDSTDKISLHRFLSEELYRELQS